MIASTNLLGTALSVLGSLVQAHFVSPDDLGFVRKYSVVSNYAIFLSFGLFSILQREYPVLMGKGEHERARRVAAIGQSWCLIASGVVCTALAVVCITQLVRGEFREACAWFIQIVAVIALLYGGFLACTYRSGHEFERLAKGTFISSIADLILLPLFAFVPFAALVLRSISSSAVSTTYLHFFRPVKVGWTLVWKDLFGLVKRGMRLFVGSYLRYQFWLTLEIWLLLFVAGDTGVGLFVFSSMIALAVGQIAIAINQVYLPRLAEHYGRTGSLTECLKLAVRPTIANVAIAISLSVVAWLVLPMILTLAFPKYVPAIPIVRVLLLDTVLVGLSLPMFMVPILEDYMTQIGAAICGMGVFIGLSFYLHSLGLRELAVAWGTISGRFVFVAVSLASLTFRLRRKPRALVIEPVSSQS